MTKQLKEELICYLMNEFGKTEEEALDDIDEVEIGLAATDIEDADGETHNLEVDYNKNSHRLVFSDGFTQFSERYWIPYERSHREVSEEELANMLDFDDLIIMCEHEVERVDGVKWGEE